MVSNPKNTFLFDENCHQCAAVKKLPKVLLENSTTIPDKIGSTFAVDIIEREGQRIIVARECLSQYTQAALIQDQTTETIRNALLNLILDIIPDTGTDVRVDGGTSFQALKRESRPIIRYSTK